MTLKESVELHLSVRTPRADHSFYHPTFKSPQFLAHEEAKVKRVEADLQKLVLPHTSIEHNLLPKEFTEPTDVEIDGIVLKGFISLTDLRMDNQSGLLYIRYVRAISEYTR
jgi:hypothetical protein